MFSYMVLLQLLSAVASSGCCFYFGVSLKENMITLFERVLPDYWGFENGILSWLRIQDWWRLEVVLLEVLKEANLKSLSLSRASEGVESSGDDFPCLGSCFSSLKLLGKWYLGKSVSQCPKNSWDLRVIGIFPSYWLLYHLLKPFWPGIFSISDHKFRSYWFFSWILEFLPSSLWGRALEV